ncbi:hypothetical protein L596_010480 [Steinernema carpocapsae]|uniref:Uncharacterized protein n=1 Tax=Steinernema carpocapsae TaxID=34508 RepID=A0A4U5PIS1_STECR|nr:hypothetical protein L596_010480 [Steinernema carpocapsae]
MNETCRISPNLQSTRASLNGTIHLADPKPRAKDCTRCLSRKLQRTYSRPLACLSRPRAYGIVAVSCQILSSPTNVPKPRVSHRISRTHCRERLRHPPELQVAAANCKTVDRTNMRVSPVTNRGIQMLLAHRRRIVELQEREFRVIFQREKDYLRLNPSAAVLRRRQEVQQAVVSLELHLSALPVFYLYY